LKGDLAKAVGGARARMRKRRGGLNLGAYCEPKQTKKKKKKKEKKKKKKDTPKEDEGRTHSDKKIRQRGP